MLRVTGRGPLEMGTWTHQGDKHVGSGMMAVTPTSPWWAVAHGAWVLMGLEEASSLASLDLCVALGPGPPEDHGSGLSS